VVSEIHQALDYDDMTVMQGWFMRDR